MLEYSGTPVDSRLTAAQVLGSWPTLGLLYLGPHLLWRHPGSTSSARRPPDRPFRLGPPRLGRPSIGFPGSDPSAWTLSHRPPSARSPGSAHSDSATPGAARSNLTYDLGRFWRFGSRPLQISAASALGRSNPQPLRSSATPPLWCSTCPALGHFGTHLLACLLSVLFVVSVIAHRCSNFWCSAAFVLGHFVALSTSGARPVQPSIARPVQPLATFIHYLSLTLHFSRVLTFYSSQIDSLYTACCTQVSNSVLPADALGRSDALCSFTLTLGFPSSQRVHHLGALQRRLPACVVLLGQL